MPASLLKIPPFLTRVSRWGTRAGTPTPRSPLCRPRGGGCDGRAAWASSLSRRQRTRPGLVWRSPFPWTQSRTRNTAARPRATGRPPLESTTAARVAVLNERRSAGKRLNLDILLGPSASADSWLPSQLVLNVDSLRCPNLSGVRGRADSSRTSPKWRF
jgi:hypothetical protein